MWDAGGSSVARGVPGTETWDVIPAKQVGVNIEFTRDVDSPKVKIIQNRQFGQPLQEADQVLVFWHPAVYCMDHRHIVSVH